MFKGFRNTAILGVVLIIGAAVLRYVAIPRPTQAANASLPAETTTVDRGEVAQTVTATGNIQANQDVDLAFTVSGKVTAVNVQQGDFVRKGQTIATLDSTTAQDAVVSAQRVKTAQLSLDRLNAPPRDVDIAVAQANVKVAQANITASQVSPTDATQIKIAQLQIEIAKNQLWQAQLQRDNNNLRKEANPRAAASLPNDNQNNRSIDAANAQITVAQYQLTATQSQGANVGSIAQAQAGLTSAQAQLDALLQGPDPNDVKQAEANLASAQAQVDQAKSDLAKTTLVAPFDGLIATVNLHLGETAPAAQAAVILDVSSFTIDLPVAELDIAKVTVGQKVTLHFDALPEATVNGKVLSISDVPAGTAPVTYTVRVVVDPASQPLKTSMSATAGIVIESVENVVRLSNRFIRLDRTHNTAFALVRQRDGTYKEVQIQIGASNDTYTEVKSGLNVGDVVGLATATGIGGGGNGAGGAGAAGGRPGGGGLPFGRLTGG